ncbi:MAG: hypothetical protein HWD59_03445 [Coxiellaceae bacterium]|nr:MAG: hypothetical protein HWD59_03445 [Coxiellaceae bacterium]
MAEELIKATSKHDFGIRKQLKKYSLALENLARMNELGLGIEINLMEAERLYHEANKYRIHQPKSDLRRKKLNILLQELRKCSMVSMLPTKKFIGSRWS